MVTTLAGGWWTCWALPCGLWTPGTASWSETTQLKTTLTVKCFVMNVYRSILLPIDEKAVHIFHECPNFKLYDLQDKPSSFTVQNGGWVIYEKPNYMVLKHISSIFLLFMQGRSLICLDGDCFSNDPNNPKGLKLKQWQTGKLIKS